MAEAAIKQSVFTWEGTDRKGKKIKGESRAANPSMVKADLRRQGINPISVKKKPKDLFGGAGSRIAPKDIAVFSRQLATMLKSGVPILGGHSIDDPEPKYGMVAIGEAHPDRLITNSAARPGDVLVLTKPLGIGIITTALKADAAPPSVIARSVEVMTTLNRGAAEVMVEEGVQAGTDVTGFGLLGHLRVMARASGVAATIRAEAEEMGLVPSDLIDALNGGS